MNNKKKLLLVVLVGVIIGLVISVTYAIFSYSKTGSNEQLITGDIYMHYKESNTLTLENALPSNTYDSSKYFEFTIDGKNTNTKYDIWYDILLNRGDVPDGKTEQNRILDKFIKFRLTEFVENDTTHEIEETEIFTNQSYKDLSSSKRIHVATIPKNTMSEITHRYRLYMWISNDVVIGNTGNPGIDYDMATWNNLFASIKVSSTGDFTEKEVNPSTPARCFEVNYNLDENNIPDETVTIIGFSSIYEDEISGEIANECLTNEFVIPSFIDGKTVTAIGSSAFYKKLTNVSSLVIPDSVTTIGDAAFQDNQLTSVEIPNSVTTIGEDAFYQNQLTSVNIPNSVTTIGGGAFWRNQLTSIIIPDSVTTIGNSAFSSNKLTSVVIPNSVTTIGGGAFGGNQLTSVEIPNSVTTIGNSAFDGNQLTSVVIPNSVTTIGEDAFRGNQLTSVTVGNGITSIGKDAFDRIDGNLNLASITIDKTCNDIKNNLLSDGTNYYPWTGEYNEIIGITIYGSNNEVCEVFE